MNIIILIINSSFFFFLLLLCPLLNFYFILIIIILLYNIITYILYSSSNNTTTIISLLFTTSYFITHYYYILYLLLLLYFFFVSSPVIIHSHSSSSAVRRAAASFLSPTVAAQNIPTWRKQLPVPHWHYIQRTLYLDTALSLPSTAVILRLTTTNSQRLSIRDVVSVFSKNSYILRRKTRPLNLANLYFQAEANDLFCTAKALQCLGLAAPQIGSQLRMFAMKDPFTGLVEMVINPVVVKKSRETLVDEEQCLSIPKYAFLVNRSKYITVNYTDNYGNRISNRTFEGLDARYSNTSLIIWTAY